MQPQFPFDNTYARLPEAFFARVRPTPVASPKLIRLNRPLARRLGFDPVQLESDDGLAALAGNAIPEPAAPIAAAYAGHQFGNFVPQLGDGRAVLLGEVVDEDGRRFDIQLKGSGPTPFSRGGDGRSPLGPVLREYVVSEAMAALGIPTTRALAAVTTGETVLRETQLPGGVFTRVAASHIRVGTFQYFAARQNTDAIRVLADYVLERHYPEAAKAPRPYRALLEAVVAAQADLIARWMHVGFIHGVMNTDNTSIAGETIDYGPCAFLDMYDPNAVFSSIDMHGRYAYAQQPSIGMWNLTRFAECLLPLFSDDTKAAVAEAEEVLDAFPDRFKRAHENGLRRKLGLHTEQESDLALVREFLQIMYDAQADFTLSFRRLSDAVEPGSEAAVRNLLPAPAAFDTWIQKWRERLTQEQAEPAAIRNAMRSVNPAYIPRNHLVEAVIRAAVDKEDFGPFHELVEVMSSPFEDQPEHAERYGVPPEPHERVLRTFCGT